jgi:hypothetical protein
MDGQLVKSINLFLDSDMPHTIGSSTGDSFDVHMNSVNIDSAQGQFIRLSLTSFSMFKNFPNVNQYNSQFVLHNTLATTNDAVLNLKHQNYGSYHDLAKEFMNTIKTQLQLNNVGNAITAALTSFVEIEGKNTNTTDRIISFDFTFTSAHGFTLTSGSQTSSQLKVLFHEHYDSPSPYYSNSDIYALLGGDRIRKSYSTTNTAAERGSIEVTVPDDKKITFTCKYPMQLYTEQFVYLHCDSFQGNNLESTSLRKWDGGTSATQSHVCDLHHSTILGRFPIQHEFIHYDAQSEREFFVDLPTNLNHLNYAKFRLTGSHGRNLHFTKNQSTLGNLNFSMVLRCDVIQKFNPNQPFTKEKERTVPPRYSNVQIDYNGHIR